MAELIAAFVEAIVGLMMAFFKALPAIIEGFFALLVASLTIIAYAISPRFRSRKRQEWADKPKKKYLELGLGSICLVSLISLAVWLSWPAPNPETGRIEETPGGGEVRLTIKVDGATNHVVIAVEKGGVQKIFETHSLDELGRAIRENVTVIHAGDEFKPGGAANEDPPIHSGRNQPSSADGPPR